MISVIITTIGRSLLGRAIESVKSQTYKDLEIIVVNDNPNFSCLEEGIKLVNNETNLGGAKSLNIGLKSAKGDYIAILDDDDWWISEDKLEKQVKFLEDNPEYIAVGTGMEGHNSPGELTLVGTPFSHSSILFRNTGILYSEDLERGKDLDIMFRLSDDGKIGILKDILVGYTVSNDVKKKIKDCSWHRKVIFIHRKRSKLWFISYLGVLKRQIRLIYYDRIKNKMFKFDSTL